MFSRKQAIVTVIISFATEVGKNSKTLGEIVFGDEAATETENSVFRVNILPRMEGVISFPAIVLLCAVAGRFGEVEGVAATDTQIETGTEGALYGVVSVEVEGQVDEAIDAPEIVRIKALISNDLIP